MSGAARYGRVAVLLGGTAAEREVSLRSGAAVLQALQAAGVDAEAFDPRERPLTELLRFDRAFNALHGRGGEDGVIQGALEMLGIPCTGSGVLGAALSMDKLRSKQIWQAMGLPTPAYRPVTAQTEPAALASALGLPLAIKPAREGSSLGMSRITEVGQIPAAIETALRLDRQVLAESWIAGAEYTATILHGEALPLIRLETPRDFYDYEAKYAANDTRYLCPCGLPAAQEARLQALALAAFAALDCRGWGRVDLMLDAAGAPWLLEVNAVPGMTDHSLVPMSARAAGLDFQALVLRILDTALTAEPAPAGGGAG